MSRSRHWRQLAIDSTGDERAIKRAYAKKLKALDPAADPQSFIALRNAYEAALGEARWIRQREENGDDRVEDWDDEEDWDVDSPVIDTGLSTLMDDDAAPAVEKPEKAIRQPNDTERTEQAWNRLQILFAAEGGVPKEIDVKLAFETLVTEPGMQQLDVSENIENAIARLICQSGPDAYFLSEAADYHFGWTERSNIERLDWPFSQAVNIAQASRIMRPILAGDGHKSDNRKWTEAWLWLNNDPPPWWNPLRWYRLRRIKSLISNLEDYAPYALHTIDWDKRAAWEPKADGFRPLPALALGTVMALAAAVSLQARKEGAGDSILSIGVLLLWLATSLALACAVMVRNRYVQGEEYYELTKSDRWALFAMLAIITFSSFGPHSGWIGGLWGLAATAALAFTRFPMLQKAQGFWEMLAISRYTAAAALLGLVMLSNGAPGGLIPIMIAAWAFTHAHPYLHAELQWRLKNRRYALHAGLVVLLALVIYLGWSGVTTQWKENGDILRSLPSAIAAIAILILTHDALTSRHNTIPLSEFYIVRFLIAATVFAMSVITLPLLIILRTIPILYTAARDWARAKSTGVAWEDHGDGYVYADRGSNRHWLWALGAIYLLFAVISVISDIKNKRDDPPAELMPMPGPPVDSYDERRKATEDWLKQPDTQEMLNEMQKQRQETGQKPAPPMPPALEPSAPPQ